MTPEPQAHPSPPTAGASDFAALAVLSLFLGTLLLVLPMLGRVVG